MFASKVTIILVSWPTQATENGFSPKHQHRYNFDKIVALKWKYYLELYIILVVDDQQSSNKQGLTPSPSNAFSPSNSDSTNGMKFLMVPGQNAQMSSFSSGKINVRCARSYIFEFTNLLVWCARIVFVNLDELNFSLALKNATYYLLLKFLINCCLLSQALLIESAILFKCMFDS